jgi:hypothetical protein
MTTGGFLSLPRVRVLWGDINLSSYNGDRSFPQNTPVVYDVSVDLSAENEGPTAEMKWDPTGPGMDLYEWFVTKEEWMKRQITIEYFYSRGKKIVFFFVWSGQSINYGNDMSITVKMQSELAGLVNANQRSTAQAYNEKKGAGPVSVVDKTTKQFGLEKYKDLVQYNPFTLEYWTKVKLATMYGNDWTYGNAISQIAKQTGDMTFANNIGKPNISVIPPYSWKEGKDGKEQDVLNAATDIKAGEAPKPNLRYGYILGPSIINSITRSANWKPPQQDNTNNPGTQTRARDPKTGRFIAATQNPPTAQQTQTENTTAKTSSPLGTSNGRANLGVQNKDNPYGPDRQNALNDEKGSELQMDTLMCPLLVGLKPHDILFVPSLTGKYMEDWIVQSVGYSQNNGLVNINVRATRVFASSSPMNKSAYDKFLDFAKKQGLVGDNATLEAWDAYAWGLPRS